MTNAHHFAARVFYEDTDFSGHVYHANYLKYCERARSDFLRAVGVDQNAMFASAQKSAFVVRRMICDFLAPAWFEDRLDIETSLVEMSGARFHLFQRVRRGDQMLFTASVTVALIDGRGRPQRIPADMAARFSR